MQVQIQIHKYGTADGVFWRTEAVHNNDVILRIDRVMNAVDQEPEDEDVAEYLREQMVGALTRTGGVILRAYQYEVTI